MRKWLIAGLVAAAIPAGLLFAVAYALTRAIPASVDAPPRDLGAESVAISSKSGLPVPGWFSASTSNDIAVLVLHGIHAHRGHMIDRLRLFQSAGFATLAIDLDGHGDNPSRTITFGYRENQSVRAAVAWLRQRLPNATISVVGLSLGGAAAVLGPEPLHADAYVLEAVFADIRNATAVRIEIRLGAWSRWLAGPLVWAGSLWTGVDAGSSSPSTKSARLQHQC